MRYGWRARVGHVSPAIVDTQAEECRKLLPPGVLHQVLSVSEPVQALTPDQLARAGGLMVEAARRLAAEEADLRKPVVAGVTAMMWHALRLIDVGDPPRGYGRLMET